MPSPKILRTSVAIPTATGDQDITIPGIGTPKAAIFILSSVVTNGTPAATARIAIGVTDGTSQVGYGMSSEDAVADSNCSRGSSNANVVYLPNPLGGGVTRTASFVSWITDGVRINWANVGASAYLMDVILIGGDHTLNAKVGEVALGTGTGAINTTLGFDPDLVFALGVGAAQNTMATGAKLSVGAWESAGGGQASSHLAEADAQTACVAAGYVSQTAALSIVDPAAGTRTYGVTLGTYASGFSATPSASASSNYMGYLALEFEAGTGVSVSGETLPTATGSYSKTGLGFKPGFLLCSGAGVGAAFATVDVTDAEGFTLTTIVPSSLCSTSFGVDDSATTMSTYSDRILTAEVEFSGAAGGTRRATSSFTSFNSDGWTKDLTATDAVAYKSIAIAIESNIPVPAIMQHRHTQGMS